MIRKERLKKGLTQEEVARAIEITVRAYVYIEKKNYCTLDNAFKLANLFNISVEELIKKNCEN